MSRVADRLKKLNLKSGDIIVADHDIIDQIQSLPDVIKKHYEDVYMIEGDPQRLRVMTDQELAHMGLYRRLKYEVTHG